MKRILRAYVIATFSLWAATQIAGGIVFKEGIQTLFLAGSGLTVALLIARPVINVLLLPLNLITFGLFRWLSSAIALYLVTLIVPGFKILSFHFAGFSSKWFDIPKVNLKGFLSYVAFSLLLSVITSFIYWIRK